MREGGAVEVAAGEGSVLVLRAQLEGEEEGAGAEVIGRVAAARLE
jgi:hypothetical protein